MVSRILCQLQLLMVSRWVPMMQEGSAMGWDCCWPCAIIPEDGEVFKYPMAGTVRSLFNISKEFVGTRMAMAHPSATHEIAIALIRFD